MKTAHITRRRVLLGAVAIAAALSAGCAAYEQKGRTVRLEDSVKLYSKSVRWSDFETASAFLRPRNGSPAHLDAEVLQSVRVVSDDFRIAAASPDSTEATMIATFRYQFEDSAVVRTVVQKATWWYDATTDTWYIDGGLPDFAR